MNKIPNHTALKEWAAVISALAAGDQILLLRKGGIADPKFGVESERFYFYPTYLHQKEKQFKPEYRHHVAATDRPDPEPERVTIDLWGEVVRVFRVDDLARLLGLERFVIFTSETIDERYRFRSDQAVHVIAVRAHRLPRAFEVAAAPELAGCRSWISLAEEIPIDGSTPVLAEEALETRLDAIERVLLADAPR